MICDGCRHQEQFEYACAVFGDKLRAILLIRELNSLSVDIIYVHSVTKTPGLLAEMLTENVPQGYSYHSYKLAR